MLGGEPTGQTGDDEQTGVKQPVLPIKMVGERPQDTKETLETATPIPGWGIGASVTGQAERGTVVRHPEALLLPHGVEAAILESN